MFVSFLVAAVLIRAEQPAQSPPPPLFVVLSDTGERRDGLPVVVAHARAQPYLALLTRGYAGRLLRLYAMAQRFARPGGPVQPAYLVLTGNQGGFPRTGFHLEGPHPGAAYVDLHRNSTLSGRAGAIDQIYPHELLHIIVADLAGRAPEGKASQVHAIGVRTDRVTAFNEGFAEHGQLMAIDATDGAPATRALAADAEGAHRAFAQMAAYRRAVAARWSIAPKARITFPLWFSRAEQVLRYHAVRENLFAHEADFPASLYTNGRAFDANLLENVLPGTAEGPAKTPARMLATEGVVSALFYRLVNTPAVQSAMRDDEFYGRFGVTRARIDPIDNAYLKLFAAIREGGYDASAVIDAYGRLFPDERRVVERVRRETLLGHEVANGQEVWLLNDDAPTGTSLFDQYRGLPRAHAFDLNAASRADLAGVPGMTSSLAVAILARAPFRTLGELEQVPGMTPIVLATFRDMQRAMDAPPAPGTAREGSLTLRDVLMPYVWRGLQVWMACAVVAAVLYRAVRRVRWWRLALNGTAAALAGLAIGWTVDPGTGVAALAAPVLIFGIPGALFTLWRSRSLPGTMRVLAAWALAGVAAALAVLPIG